MSASLLAGRLWIDFTTSLGIGKLWTRQELINLGRLELGTGLGLWHLLLSIATLPQRYAFLGVLQLKSGIAGNRTVDL